MKTIGIIGGMSWESSKFYYKYINKIVAKRLGGSHSARILMSSVDFAEIETLSFEDNWNKIGELMAIEAKKLETAGADVVILATNTIHLVAQYIEDEKAETSYASLRAKALAIDNILKMIQQKT